MTRIAVVTDSTCGLPEELISENHIFTVPCQVHIGDASFREGIDLSAEDMFQRMFDSVDTPSTSLPSGEDYAATYTAIQDQGYEQVLGIFVGSSLSGTFNGARLNAEGYGFEIELVDSGTTSVALGLLVLEALRLVKLDITLDEAASLLRQMSERTELYALLDTLEYIRRGGRIGRMGEMIANVFNIKPVLRIAGNSVDVVSRSRSFKRGLSWLRTTADEAAPLAGGAVMHTGALSDASELAEHLSRRVESEHPVFVAPAGAAVAVHSGPKAVGVGLLRAA